MSSSFLDMLTNNIYHVSLYSVHVQCIHDSGLNCIEEALVSLRPMLMTRIPTRGKLLETSGKREICASGRFQHLKKTLFFRSHS